MEQGILKRNGWYSFFVFVVIRKTLLSMQVVKCVIIDLRHQCGSRVGDCL